MEDSTPATTPELEFARACRKLGLADTPQRRTIYKALADSLDHPTAELLWARVKKQLPRVSLATVYRNLKVFVDAGLIEEVATGSSFARYDANRAHHHHLICRACGKVADYYSAEFDGLGERVGDEGGVSGFEVHDLKVNLFGLCAACRVPADSRAEHGNNQQEEETPWEI